MTGIAVTLFSIGVTAVGSGIVYLAYLGAVKVAERRYYD